MRRTDLTFRLGTMGFFYKDWRGVFYPQSVQPADRLAWYARRFDTVELDTTFHAVPPIERVAIWADAVPDDFRFLAKVPKAITHEPDLHTKAEALTDFARVLRPMGEKLSFALLQFPPTSGVELAGPLNRLLDQFHLPLPLAVEVRHRSWFAGGALPALRDRGVTVVANDYLDQAQPILGPSDRIYVRLIGEHDRFATKDHEQLDVDARLDWWLDQVEARALAHATIYIVANNDYAGHSPATIRRLRAKLGMPDTTPAAGSPDAPSLFG